MIHGISCMHYRSIWLAIHAVMWSQISYTYNRCTCTDFNFLASHNEFLCNCNRSQKIWHLVAMLMTCRYAAELFSQTLTYTTMELATFDIGKRKEQCRLPLRLSVKNHQTFWDNIKTHGSESRGQEEAACMRVFWPTRPLQWVIYTDGSSKILKRCNSATIAVSLT